MIEGRGKVIDMQLEVLVGGSSQGLEPSPNTGRKVLRLRAKPVNNGNSLGLGSWRHDWASKCGLIGPGGTTWLLEWAATSLIELSLKKLDGGERRMLGATWKQGKEFKGGDLVEGSAAALSERRWVCCIDVLVSGDME